MFTPYYIFAICFGVFALVVTAVGIKQAGNENFPGRLYGPIMLIGVILAVGTFAFAWRGGEQEVDHRKHEEAAQSHEAASVPAPPPAVKSAS